jgi:trans-aconitate methyltransferase
VKEDQYARQADDWTERAYADAAVYLAHRAELIITLGTRLEPGDEVLDLACGDAGLGESLLAAGLRYRGIDSTPEMIAEARRRLGDRAPVEAGDLNEYAPPAPVAATTIFRAIYYARDRRGFFRHVSSCLRPWGCRDPFSWPPRPSSVRGPWRASRSASVSPTSSPRRRRHRIGSWRL